MRGEREMDSSAKAAQVLARILTFDPDKPTLSYLRGTLSDSQKRLIEYAWGVFRSTGGWPWLRTLYSKLGGKAAVQEEMRSLGGSIGYEWEEAGSGRYKLTLLGGLLTPDGPSYQKLLERFLGFQRNLFRDLPEAKAATSEQIANALHLQPDERVLLGQLLFLGHLGGSNAAHSENWEVRAMAEAEEFPEEGDLSAEVEKLAMRSYKRDEPVFATDRRGGATQWKIIRGDPTPGAGAGPCTRGIARDLPAGGDFRISREATGQTSRPPEAGFPDDAVWR